ncbi:MAG: DUF4234 domain-containing protein [Desulfurococcaceae archaeon]
MSTGSLAEHYIAEMRRISREAAETDYVMPIWLPFIPMILILIGLLASIPALLGGKGALAGLGAFFVLIFIGAIINIYVLYKWISRRNNHFRRTASLYGNLVSALESLKLTDAEVAQIRSSVQEMQYEEREKSAALWIILSLIVGIVILYVYHFLNKDFHKHERREVAIYENLARILERRGIAVSRLEPRIPSRSTILYIVLSIITLGIFGLYWIYTLTRDPNEHFRAHHLVEENAIRALEQLARTPARP